MRQIDTNNVSTCFDGLPIFGCLISDTKRLQDLQNRYVRSVKRLLDSHNTPTFLCDPVPGEDIHEVAAEGLAAARFMVAFCSETYGGSSSRDSHFYALGL